MTLLRVALTVIVILAASTWIGSLVCIAVVARVARGSFEPPITATLMRAVGSRYAVLGTGSLVVSILGGVSLAWSWHDWPGLFVGALVVAVVLVATTVVAMGQARSVGRSPVAGVATGTSDAAALISRRRRTARLRGVMGLLTILDVILVAWTLAR